MSFRDCIPKRSAKNRPGAPARLILTPSGPCHLSTLRYRPANGFGLSHSALLPHCRPVTRPEPPNLGLTAQYVSVYWNDIPNPKASDVRGRYLTRRFGGPQPAGTAAGAPSGAQHRRARQRSQPGPSPCPDTALGASDTGRALLPPDRMNLIVTIRITDRARQNPLWHGSRPGAGKTAEVPFGLFGPL